MIVEWRMHPTNTGRSNAPAGTPSARRIKRMVCIRNTGAKLTRCLTRPSFEGMLEGALLTVTEQKSNFRQRNGGVTQKDFGTRAAHSIDQFAKTAPAFCQSTM